MRRLLEAAALFCAAASPGTAAATSALAAAAEQAERRITLAARMPGFCAIGRWTGTLVEPGAAEPYTIHLVIRRRKGGVFEAEARYPELNCAARGEWIDGPRSLRILFREIVVQNRDTCVDGRYAVTCLANERLHWRWFYDDGTGFEAVLTR